MRYKELDGLRGIAALSVYFSHLIGVFVINSSLFDRLSNSPFHIFWHGEAAVTLFFLLSGFVLTLPYIKNRVDLNLPSFYLKRVFRIYPAFIVAIVFSVLLKTFLFDPSQMRGYSAWINEFWKWSFKDIAISEIINTLILAGRPFDKSLFDPVVGTLRVEMIISFILPFLIFIALRIKLVFNLLVLFLLFFIGKDTTAIFYLGIVIAIFRNDIGRYINSINNDFYKIIFFIIASVFYTSRFSLSFIFDNYNKFSMLLSVLGCGLFLILAMKNEVFSFILNTSLVQFLGKISYSLYLFHFPVLLIVCSLLPNNFFLIFLISLVITVVLSYLSYEFIEMPFVRLGKTITVNRLDFLSNKTVKVLSNFKYGYITNLKTLILKRQ